jgi:hypothetical protein
MAVPAKDGSMHHSAGRANLHDQMSAGAEKKSKVADMKKPSAGDGKTEPKKSGSTSIPHDHPHMAGPHQTPSDTSIGEHVAEHGPATHVHHAHHEESGKHHVTTHHGGMGQNMHHSEHDTAEEAHAHMGEAMGGEDATDESPDDVNENPAETTSTGAGNKIPGLV